VNISPQLDIADAPAGTASLVLIMDDPDAPGGTWDHWIAYDIAPTDSIAAGNDSTGTGGLNSWGKTGYGGPCPPSGTHRYFFKVFALDAVLGLSEGSDSTAVTAAMEGHVLSEATLPGTFAH
jgi:Raf kinase inhibitor-like YbhB/YbcL family protein